MKWAHELELYRIQLKPYFSRLGDPYGLFMVPHGSVRLKVLADSGDQTGWEHVSVSLPNRCPNWLEMSAIKDLFWGVEETVMQLHVPKSDHVDMAKTCLHLWRPRNAEIPRPPSILVGL